MAPPLGLTSSMLGWCSFSHASTTEAKASLISTASMSSSVNLARSNTVVVAGGGPVSIVTGATPAPPGGGGGGEGAPGAQAQRVRLLLAHDEHGGGAVGDLRGIPRRDLAILFE